MSDAPRKPLGQTFDRSEAELDRLSKVGPEDVVAARQLWHANAPARFRGLIDALPVLPSRPDVRHR